MIVKMIVQMCFLVQEPEENVNIIDNCVLFCLVLFCLMIMIAVKHYDCENDYIQCVFSFKNLKRTSIL